MKSLYKAIDKFQEIINGLISLVLMVIMVIILAQTVGRAVHLSIPWSEEASRYLFVVMILLGINIGISRNMMVRIDMIDLLLKGGVKKAFELFREVIGLVVAVVFFYSTFPMIKVGGFQKSPAMQIPMSFLYAVMAVGFGLAVLAMVIRLIKLFIPDEKEA
jgi:TRAP-type C4-dicarboxylate transport system permease small subunit